MDSVTDDAADENASLSKGSEKASTRGAAAHEQAAPPVRPGRSAAGAAKKAIERQADQTRRDNLEYGFPVVDVEEIEEERAERKKEKENGDDGPDVVDWLSKEERELVNAMRRNWSAARMEVE